MPRMLAGSGSPVRVVGFSPLGAGPAQTYGRAMNPNTIKTFLRRHVVDEIWRPGDPRIHVRKRRPALGWTINLAALVKRLRAPR